MTNTSRIRRPRHRELDGLARGRLDHNQDDLEVGLRPSPLGGGTPIRQFVFTATNATNVVTVAGEDDLASATEPPRAFLNGDDLPDGLSEGVIYWLRDAGTNDYTLHPTAADAAADTNIVTFADDGTGTLTITILEP